MKNLKRGGSIGVQQEGKAGSAARFGVYSPRVEERRGKDTGGSKAKGGKLHSARG
jgi:hypothetical protein